MLGALLIAIAVYRPLDPLVIPAWYRAAGDAFFVIVCLSLIHI